MVRSHGGVGGNLASRQLGRLKILPRALTDRGLISPLVCTVDDDYPSIAPDFTSPQVNPEPPTYALHFCPVPGSEHLLGLANEDGSVHVQDTSKVQPKIPLTGRRCHDNAIFAFCWAARDASRLVTASGDQTVAVWQLQQEGDQPLRRLRGHSRSVKSVEWRPESDQEFASAGRDNTVMVWDLRCGGDTVPENCIRNAHSTVPTTIGKSRARSGSLNPQQGSCSVTGLCWLDTTTLASLGDSDGKVKLWDLRKSYSLYRGDPVPKAELVHPATSSTRGFTSLSCSPASPSHIYVSCMDSCIYQYDVVNLFQQPTAVFTGAEIKNFFINHSISPCGRYLASGSGDQWVYLWHTSSPGSPVARLGPQDAEVTAVTWNHHPASFLLAAASDDVRHRLWRDQRILPDPENVRGRAEMLQKSDEPLRFVSPPRRVRGTLAGVLTPVRSAEKKTPTSGLRKSSTIEAFLTPKQKLAPVAEGEGATTPTNIIKRGLKRRTVDFNDENSAPKEKQAKIEDNGDLSANINRLLSSPSSKCTFSPSSYQSPTKRVPSPRKLGSPLKKLTFPLTPVSSSTNMLPLTPVRSHLLSSSNTALLACTRSPTANLPNLVVDGRSPRHRPAPPSCSTVSKPTSKTTDWLTEMARKRGGKDIVTAGNKKRKVVAKKRS